MSRESEPRSLFVVDGYNVIAVDPSRREDFATDPEHARMQLVEDVASFAAGGDDAVVVFDGHGNPRSTGEPLDVAGIRVVFSPWGVEADALIEEYVHAARSAGVPVVLVTSDSETRQVAAGPGVSLIPSRDFDARLAEVQRESAAHAEQRVASRLEDRLDEETRRVLWDWIHRM